MQCGSQIAGCLHREVDYWTTDCAAEHCNTPCSNTSYYCTCLFAIRAITPTITDMVTTATTTNGINTTVVISITSNNIRSSRIIFMLRVFCYAQSLLRSLFVIDQMPFAKVATSNQIVPNQIIPTQSIQEARESGDFDETT